MNELPQGWTTTSLREVADLITDGDHNPPKRVAEGIPHLTARNVREGHFVLEGCTFISHEDFRRTSKRYAPAAGDVVVTCVGTLGETAIVPEGLLFSADRNLAAIRPREVVLSSFLKAMLDSPQLQKDLRSGSGSTAQPHLYLGKLRELSIPLPPLGEQRKIVAAIEQQFSRLDAGSSSLAQTQHNLMSLRASIINDLLRTKDGKFYADTLLGDILDLGRYGTSTKCSYDGKGMPVLRIPNIQSGEIDLTDMKYAMDVSVNLKGSIVEPGDVLIVRTNGSRSLIGKTAVVQDLPSEMAFASYLIQLRMDRSAVEPSYLAAALHAPYVRRRIESLAATTAGQYNISLEKLRSLRVPLPPLNQQRKALRRNQYLLSGVDRMEKDIKQSFAKATRLRSSILSAAFSGKLT